MDISKLENSFFLMGMRNAHLFPQILFIYFFFNIQGFFNGFIETLQCEIFSFLIGNGISASFCVKKWYFPCAVEISFLHTKGCGNAPFINFPQN